MQVIDLSHVLETGMPVFPGSEPARLDKCAMYESEGFNETLLHISSHTGTHLDCGRHLLKDGFDTGSSLAERFIGKGMVIDCRNTDGRPVITRAQLQRFGHRIRNADFVLLHTGWSRFWGRDEYLHDFPVPDEEAARYLAHFKLKGAGIDAISFDPMGSGDYVIHKILLNAGMILVENLTSLDILPEEEFLFCCFPLKIADGDGSPVRAVGIVTSHE